jgi:hypothetical protein
MKEAYAKKRHRPLGSQIDSPMTALSKRQRHILIVLGLANLIALSTLGVLFLRARSSDGASSSPLSPQRQEVCRQAISQALLDAGQSGMVQTLQDGTIVVRLQRPLITAPPSRMQAVPANQLHQAVDAMQVGTQTVSRFDADAAIWTALQAVASQSGCLDHSAVQVTVLFTPSTQNQACAEKTPMDTQGTSECQPLRATARVGMPDLLLWWLGGIDDAELTLRVDYQPPAAIVPVIGTRAAPRLPEATGIP